MPVIIFNLPILAMVVAVVVTLTAGHAVEQELPTTLDGHGYGPAIHISSGVLQLAADTEAQTLLLVPSSVYSQPWPHFYVEGVSSHLPHSGLPQPHLPAHEPRIVISDNVDFSQLKHPLVKAHGR
ncbi:uncharacterized protein [Drosophila pseudoobscura]|uniref:Uncharacterized protein n=1 Tax=Drosophila pseudoobscura pseudoobscura TaxID=46245 RepID=A0A6I8UZ82_DROPS|nr:uncharacterized protein LOC6901223 [Drosophila pseudoobscura]